MLDTILEIGKVFKRDSIRHHCYVKPCPLEENIWSIPVKKDFSFDFEGMRKIENENEIKKLSYLTFKTSRADNNSFRYIFGDIYYRKEKGQEKEFYRIHIQPSSFERGWKYIQTFGDSFKYKLRESFQKNISKNEKIII
jgi:hypothetical protein